MHFSSRSKMGIALSLLTIITLISGFAVTMFVRGNTLVHAASPTYTIAQGHVTKVATQSLATLSTNAVKPTGQTPFDAISHYIQESGSGNQHRSKISSGIRLRSYRI